MLPDKNELAAIDEAIKECSALPTEARAAAIEAFSAGEFTADSVQSWLAVAQVKRPELWAKAADKINPEDDAERVQAYVNQSPYAKGRRVLKIGEAGAEAEAIAWGLNGLHDYKSKGVRPGAPPAADDGNPDKSRDNPWSAAGWNITAQGRIAKADMEAAQRMARNAHSYVGATRPTK